VSSERFTAAVEAGDLDAMRDALAEDVVFRSPVVYKPYEGREATLFVLAGAFRVFEDFEYIDKVEGEGSAALVFRARVGERDVEGLDHLTFDADGRVSELRVMVRPMSGMHALAEAMRAELERAGAAASAASE
jgi:SnoaL-like domain